MKILIIGGTKFVGRHLVKAGIAKGHKITIFHRGVHNLESFPGVEEILGDRNTDINKLLGRTWSAVIDTCGYLPQSVESTIKLLKNTIRRYVFISSISAYSDFSTPGFEEDSKLASLTPEQEAGLSEIDPLGELNGFVLGESYGALKVLCEKMVQKHMPDSSLILRPGLIVGEYDFTDRFTYWVMRVAKGGEVLAPGSPETFVQFIDAKDLAEWTIRMIEGRAKGIYNAASPPFSISFGSMLEKIRKVTKSDAKFTWVDAKFMEKHEVVPWSDMPVYFPETEDMKGFSAAGVSKAIEHGLEFRDLEKTIEDILRWRAHDTADLASGISIEREKELLRKWHEQSSI